MNDSDPFAPDISTSSFGAPGLLPEANSQLPPGQTVNASNQ